MKAMKTMIYSFLMAAATVTPLVGCSDNNDVVEQRDWSTTTLFASSDLAAQDIYYKPQSGYVGDPMPFYDPVAKDFKILYLQDYRPNPVGTYHPIWAVSTTDAASYTSLGEMIPCGGINEQDAAIGTGSTVYNENDKLYYTFFTGHKYELNEGDSREMVMMATSPDFKTWTKSRTFYLRGADYGYEKNDFRDPFVFRGDDNLYHMLVSAKKGGKGVLAEWTSTDMKEWNHKGVFMTYMWDRFYECPDVFKMGDWWYLVYSEQHNAIRRVQYFKGRTLDELKACTRNDAGLWPDAHEGFLDSRGLYAGKTASDGTNRYIWGWCATRSGKDNTKALEWAGNLVAHKLIQHEDGTLTLGEVPAIAAKFTDAATPAVAAKSENSDAGTVEGDASNLKLTGNAWALFPRLAYKNRIEFTVKTSGNRDKFGISLVRGTDADVFYSLVVNDESDDTRKINLEQQGEKGCGFLADNDGYVFQRPADNTYHIVITTDNSVCTMYVNDHVCYTNRIYGIQRNCWSINSYSGTIEVSGLKVAGL